MFLCIIPIFSFSIIPAETHAHNENDDDFKWVSCSRTDGFGSQYQCQMVALAIARHDGKCFKYIGFRRHGFHHHSGHRLQTGLKSDNCTHGQEWDIQTATILHKLGHTADDFWTDAVRSELRNLFWSAQRETQSSSTTLCEVALHIRRGDAGGDRFISNEVYHDAIATQFPNKKVCVVSEGRPADFGSIQALQNVELILTSDTGYAFQQLVAAPELVISQSSFSYAAALLNKGQIWYVKGFWHDALKDWRQVFFQKEHMELESHARLEHMPKYEPIAESDFD